MFSALDAAPAASTLDAAASTRMASTHSLDASTLAEHVVTLSLTSRPLPLYLDARFDARLDAASTARRHRAQVDSSDGPELVSCEVEGWHEHLWVNAA